MDAVLELAQEEIGYVGKQTKEHLEAKSDYPGTNNFTKYFNELFPNEKNRPWCVAFIVWCFIQAYGEDGLGMLGLDSPTWNINVLVNAFKGMVSYMKHYFPKKGDIVFLRTPECLNANHVGIVTDCGYDSDGEYVFKAISGNNIGADGFSYVEENEYSISGRIYVAAGKINYENTEGESEITDI